MNPTKILSLIEDKNIYNLLRGDGPFMAEDCPPLHPSSLDGTGSLHTTYSVEKLLPLTA